MTYFYNLVSFAQVPKFLFLLCGLSASVQTVMNAFGRPLCDNPRTVMKDNNGGDKSCSLTAIRLVRVVKAIPHTVIHLLHIDTLTSRAAGELVIAARSYGSDKEIVKLLLKDLRFYWEWRCKTIKQNKINSDKWNNYFYYGKTFNLQLPSCS